MQLSNTSELTVPGFNGRIEARYTRADDPTAPVVLLLPPDPRFGGTLNNPTVTGLHQAFRDSGFTVLRIGYGEHDDPVEEDEDEEQEEAAWAIGDASAAMNHLQKICPDTSSIWVAGYSFGSWVALQILMRRPEVVGFVAVSPVVNRYDYTFLSPCPASGLFVTGRNDKIVPRAELQEFIKRLREQTSTQITHREIRKASHLFEGQSEEVRRVVTRYLAEWAPRLADPPDAEGSG